MDAASVTMSMGDYLLYSVMGICVVFFALILLIGIIKLMWIQPSKKSESPAAAAATEAGANAASVAEKPLAPGSAGDLKLYDTDPRDAAMIMAIVADELKKPLNELRFLSIREIDPK